MNDNDVCTPVLRVRSSSSFPIAFNSIRNAKPNSQFIPKSGYNILSPRDPNGEKGATGTLCLDPLWAAKPCGRPDSQEAPARPFAPHLDFLVTGTPLSFNVKLQRLFTILIWRYSSILWFLRYQMYLLSSFTLDTLLLSPSIPALKHPI